MSMLCALCSVTLKFPIGELLQCFMPAKSICLWVLMLLYIVKYLDLVLSQATWRRCYREKWEMKLKMRRIGQHKKCADCIRYEEFRMLCSTLAEKKEIARERLAHLKVMKQD